MELVIYTDGSCRGNPGPGGYGVVVIKDGAIIDATQYSSPLTTNNKMEMEAIIWATEKYGATDEDFIVPIVYSDSAYCVNSFTNWIDGWKRNGWKRAGNKPLENLDLIKRYDKLRQFRHVELRKVPGHAGELGNELADGLATGVLTVDEVLNYD